MGRLGGRFTIRCGYPAESIALGASIACEGACLTATRSSPPATAASFTVDVSNETLAKTTLGDWQAGRRINLERALKAGDELGGHMVSGHVDGVARIVSNPLRWRLAALHVEAPAEFARYIAPKGSVALDGISLTVNEVTESRLASTSSLIP